MKFTLRHMVHRPFKIENLPLNTRVVWGGLLNLNVPGFSIQYTKVFAVDVY